VHNWSHDINFIDRSSSKPKRPKSLHWFEDSRIYKRCLENLYQFILLFKIFKTFELSIQHISKSNVQVPLYTAWTKFILDELEQIGCIIKWILIEESVNHAPRPCFDNMVPLLSDLIPKFFKLFNSFIFLSYFMLSQDMSIQSWYWNSRDNMIFRLTSHF
jgi:hypothetical protein